MKRAWLALWFALLVQDPLWAHGGSYRPPLPPGFGGGAGRGGSSGGGPPGPSAPGPSAPGSGRPGPALPPTGPTSPRNPYPLLPTTGPKDELPGPALWQVWWSYNHDAFLDVRGRLHALAASSGVNPMVAERRRLQELLAPVLVETLQAGGKDSVIRQCLLALARLAKVEELAVPLERWVEIHLGRSNPNLQEAALLALGVGGDGAAIERLRHVLMDDAAGREILHQEGTVPIRLRAFAAYALGLLGRREPAEGVRRSVVHALLFALGQEGVVEREVRVACVLALGLVPIQPCTSATEALDPARQIEELHLCGGVQTEFLLGIARDPVQDAWLRGHAAAALGRLAQGAGAGFPATEDHPAILARADLVRALTELARETRGTPEVLQGALLGLGAVVDADGDEVDQEARKVLLEGTKRDGAMAQRFALLGLAAALGRPGAGVEPDTAWKGGSALLVREFLRAKTTGLPWHALSLLVAGHGRVAHQQPVPTTFTDALRVNLLEAKELEEAAAYALGMAVLRPSDPAMGSALMKAFDRHEHAGFRTYGALALGMLGVRNAMGQLEKALDAAGSSPEAAIAASLGLRLLGDPDIVPDLVKRVVHADMPRTREALTCVHALAFLQDPSAGEPLLPLVADEKRKEDLRSAIVWCLGVLADPEAPDWTARYANGLDYNHLPWTLRSPLEDGRGLLDWR